MKTQKWLDDIQDDAQQMPFGDITFTVKRHRNMTTVVEATTHSKIRYNDNLRAFSDLEKLINNLIEANFTGKLLFELTLKEGTIESTTIKNKKETNYRDKQ